MTDPDLFWTVLLASLISGVIVHLIVFSFVVRAWNKHGYSILQNFREFLRSGDDD